MPDRLPDRLFPERLATASTRIKGYWMADQCVRLQGLVERVGDIELELAFEHKASGHTVVNGTLTTGLQLACQRCLRSFNRRLKAPLRLAVCRPDSDFSTIPPGYEPLEVDEDGGIDTQQFIEDEVIVRIPGVPMHADLSQCDPDMVQRSREFDVNARTDNAGERKQNPFAILKKKL
jgi:uncharacterized protein